VIVVPVIALETGQFFLASCAAASDCLAVMPRIPPVMVSLMPVMSEDRRPVSVEQRFRFDSGSSERGFRHLLELRHQRPVRVGPVADSRDAGIRPIGLWRRARESD